MHLSEAARKIINDIRLVIFDVDGVLTDGGLYYLNDGNIAKKFYVKDGTGIRLLQKHGYEIAFITGLESEVVNRRAEDLKVRHVIQGSHDKAAACAGLLEDLNLDWSQAAYLGDDLIDLEVMQKVAFPAAVADAVEEVLETAIAITELPGGMGAAREFCDLFLGHAHKNIASQ